MPRLTVSLLKTLSNGSLLYMVTADSKITKEAIESFFGKRVEKIKYVDNLSAQVTVNR